MVASIPRPLRRLPSSATGIADQLVWSLQNFIPLLTVSRFLPSELNNFALVAACLAVLTGGVLQVAGEYLSTWDRARVADRDPDACAALWRRSMAAAGVAAASLMGAALVLGGRGPLGLSSALAWAALVALPLQAYEAERVWLLLTKQTVSALRLDTTRLGIHIGAVTILYVLGAGWSMGTVVGTWGGAAFVTTLAATRTNALQWLARDTRRLDIDWKRQGRYAGDYLLFLGPENLAIFVMGIVGSYSFTGSVRLCTAAFTAANAAIVGVRALNTVPGVDPLTSTGRRRILELAGAGVAIMLLTGIVAALVPPGWVAVIVGDTWFEAREALGGVTVQRVAATVVVFGTLWFRWLIDDYAVSLTRRMWAVGVIAGAAATGFTVDLRVAAWIYGAVALFGAVSAVGLTSWIRLPPGQTTTS